MPSLEEVIEDLQTRLLGGNNVEWEQIKIRPLRQDDFERLNEIRVSKGVFENILALDTETLAETIDYFTDNSNPKSKYTYIAEKLR